MIFRSNQNLSNFPVLVTFWDQEELNTHDFTKKMFLELEVGVLGILLDACRMSGNLELGTLLLDIDMAKPTDARNYLQVA